MQMTRRVTAQAEGGRIKLITDRWLWPPRVSLAIARPLTVLRCLVVYCAISPVPLSSIPLSSPASRYSGSQRTCAHALQIRDRGILTRRACLSTVLSLAFLLSISKTSNAGAGRDSQEASCRSFETFFGETLPSVAVVSTATKINTRHIHRGTGTGERERA